MWVKLEWTDGAVSAKQVGPDDVDKLRDLGCDVVMINPALWPAWQAHMAQVALWDSLWSALANEASRGREV